MKAKNWFFQNLAWNQQKFTHHYQGCRCISDWIYLSPMGLSIYPYIQRWSKYIQFHVSQTYFLAYYDQIHRYISKLRSIFSIEIPNLSDLAIFWKLDFKIEEVIFLKLHRLSVIIWSRILIVFDLFICVNFWNQFSKTFQIFQHGFF